ncbi:MAG: sugar ABC transporter substrate-binding protein [Firmicutes bacterium]|nr:sugar ABC transporter substrate-binding protein [Bacillota bacterium]
MKKSFAALFLVVLLSVSAFAADYYPEYTGRPTTITMWAWTSNENYSIEEFQKVYPDITVVWEDFGVHYEKAQTALAAGSGLPDVLMVEYSFAPEYMDLGAFQPINKWLDEETFIALYGEEALGWCSMDGQIYGTPQDSGAIALFYRQDLFDQYGLEVPRTWEEFAEQARKFKAAAPDLEFNAPPLGYALWWVGLVWQSGGKMFDYSDGNWYIDFTNPIAEKVFEFWGELIDEGTINVTMWWNADWYNSLNMGTTATVLNGCWFAEWLRYNAPDSEGMWRVIAPPNFDPSNPHNGMLGGSGFYVTAHSKNPEAAAIFVNWLNSHPDSLRCLNQYSNLPIMVSKRYEEVVHELAVDDAFFGGQNIVEELWHAHNLINTTFVGLPIWSNLDNALSLLLQDYVDGKIERFADILPMWEERVIGFMEEFGYPNVIIGELPQD